MCFVYFLVQTIMYPSIQTLLSLLSLTADLRVLMGKDNYPFQIKGNVL